MPRQKVSPPAPLGIPRPRLTALILRSPPGVRLVVGPAGSGKTTALAHAAAAFEGRSVWLSLDGTDRHPAAFARTLGAAASLGPEADVLAVVAALDDGDPTLLVLDDVHEVAGSPAGDAIELLCRYRPPQVTVALGARDLRELHQWRWRSDPSARPVDVDQLRFRLWEVDELFRHLDAPLAPADVHALTRRTDGWAVALRLFHIALRDAPGGASSLLARSPRFTHRSIRGYLREEVLSRITAEQRTFLTRTAVLDRLDPVRCDELLDGAGSTGQLLEELSAGGLLVPDVDGTGYRLHDLVRDHLLAELAAEVGADAVAALHSKAARLLEQAGALRDATRCAARAGDWDGVRRLLRLVAGDGPSLPDIPEIPAAVRDHDPWVLRADALRRLCDGDLRGGAASLRAAVDRFAESGGDPATDALLRSVNAWVRPSPGQPRSWVAALRAALAGGEVGAFPAEQGGRFARGVADLAAGRVGEARASLAVAVAGPQPQLSALAGVGAAVAAHLAGLGEADAERALSLARAAGAPAVVVAAELVSSGAAVVHAGPAGDGADDVGGAFRAFWSALVDLARRDGPAPDLAAAAALLERQSLQVPASVVRAAALVVAAARSGEVDVRAARDPQFRAAGPLAHALATLALGLAGDRPARHAAHRLAGANGFGPWLEAVERCQREAQGPLAAAGGGPGGATDVAGRPAAAPPTAAPAAGEPDPVPGPVAGEPVPGAGPGVGVPVPGAVPPAAVPGSTAVPPAGVPPAVLAVDGLAPAALGAGAVAPAAVVPPPPLAVQVLGGFAVRRHGVALDLSELRPRHLELLQLLAANAGHWVHRETLWELLWSGRPPEAAAHNLHVAVSAVRRLLEPEASRGRSSLLRRSGDRYQLDVPAGDCDVGRLEHHLHRAVEARRGGQLDVAGAELGRAVEEWRGELVPSAGPVEWAVARRDQLRHRLAAAAADVLANVAPSVGSTALAARVVAIEPADDLLWRLAIDHARSVGAAARLRELEAAYRARAGGDAARPQPAGR